MQISKNQSIVIAFVTIGLFVTMTIFVITMQRKEEDQSRARMSDDALNKTTETEEKTLAEKTIENVTDSGSEFVLNDFHRVETQGGKILWEVKAKKGQYFAKSNTAKINEGTVWIFKKNGDVTRLDAGEAILTLNGVSLAKVNAYNGVKIVQDDKLTVLMETADYDKEKNTVFSPSKVKITGQGLEVTGSELSADLEAQTFKIAKEVSTVIDKRKS